ncbi:MAG: transporter [Gammaproteobacteria bacterium]|nr:transporter [Gammaproteobacteria bacterium]MDH5692941.1 transporter [Gammaproteobacteria bacterium]
MPIEIFRRSLKPAMLGVFALVASSNALALGECGLSCCLAGANSSGVALAENFGLAIQYEYSDMKTLRKGHDKVSATEVIESHWMPGMMYAVPNKMTMEKVSFIGALPINERWTMIGIVPVVRNNMEMKMRNSAGMSMDMQMDEISGLGDVSLMGFYTAYTDAPIMATKRLTLGMGLKTPTGKNDERTASGDMVHAMMQAGSGSWDGLFTLNYMHAFSPVVTQINAFYHLSNKGDKGYEFGDQIGLDLIARYQAVPLINIGLELNMIHTTKDKDHESKYSRPTMSMLDNPAYTGLTSILLAPGVQFRFKDLPASLELKYQKPIHQHVNGYQQVLDQRVLATGTWSW